MTKPSPVSASPGRVQPAAEPQLAVQANLAAPAPPHHPLPGGVSAQAMHERWGSAARSGPTAGLGGAVHSDQPDRRPAVGVTPADAKANQLVGALPEETYARWAPHLEAVEMRLGEVLHDSSCPVGHVYFPTTSIVSLLHILESGASAEIAVVGNEGIVGVSSFMGGHSTPNQSVVRSAGRGYRLPASVLLQSFEQGGPVAQLMLRYTQALIAQVAQMAACNRHHTLSQQLCRLLLFSLDRLQTRELWMTQELIGNMLGVRREGVTEAALILQKAGLIRYSRGHILVLDRPGLESRSCECYSVVKKEYERLLTYSPASTN